jgi:hypothetical protein
MLIVDKIDGQALLPIAIRIENLEDPLPLKTRVILKGYESGRFIAGDQKGFHFSRYFITSSVVEPKELHLSNRPKNE